MKLVPNWRQVLRRAWSVRFALVTAVMSAGGATLVWLSNDHDQSMTLPFMVGTFMTSVGGLAARILWQGDFDAAAHKDD